MGSVLAQRIERPDTLSNGLHRGKEVPAYPRIPRQVKPQDNMPVMVPDTSRLERMPVAKSDSSGLEPMPVYPGFDSVPIPPK